jgi:mycothiol synthase
MTAVELRPLRVDDLDEVCALINRTYAHDGPPRVMSLEELREEIDVPFVDVDVDARVALRGDTLAGWTWIWNPPSVVREEQAYLFGEVEPSQRGHGVGRALLAWGVERAIARLQGRHHDLPRYIRVVAYDWLEANHHLFARFGFAPVRYSDELIRPLAGSPAAPLPGGAALVPWPDGRDEEIRKAHNEAFADHWGSTPTTAESWQNLVRGHGARLDVSVIALDAATNEVVGLCLNHAYPEDDEATGRREAWIDSLATVKPWRGRGLASAMIRWSLAAFAQNGFTHALLGVDTDNPTGAARLYRSLGFEPLRRSVTYQIELR